MASESVNCFITFSTITCMGVTAMCPQNSMNFNYLTARSFAKWALVPRTQINMIFNLWTEVNRNILWIEMTVWNSFIEWISLTSIDALMPLFVLIFHALLQTNLHWNEIQKYFQLWVFMKDECKSWNWSWKFTQWLKQRYLVILSDPKFKIGTHVWLIVQLYDPQSSN